MQLKPNLIKQNTSQPQPLVPGQTLAPIRQEPPALSHLLRTREKYWWQLLSPSCSQAERETEANTEEGRSQRWTEARILLTFTFLRINLPLDRSFTRINKFPLPLSLFA